MKILFLSRWYPCPPDNGARIRVFNFLRGLSSRNEVTLLSFSEPGSEAGLDGVELRESYSVPWKEYEPLSRRGLLGLLSRAPRSIVDTYSEEMEDVIGRTLDEERYDLIIASELTMASYSRVFGDTAAILEELEVGGYHQRFKGAQGSLERFRHHLTWEKLGAYLRQLLPRFQFCTVVSEDERDLLAQLAPGYKSVEVIPNGVDVAGYSGQIPSLHEKSLIFCGSCDYGPNYQGISWFLEKVYPIIKSRDPDIRLTVTGNGRKLPVSSHSGVVQTGYVDDVKPLISAAGVSIVPILSGGGTRLKILESMALGTPVVSTTKGAEGLQVANGLNLIIGDTPEMFAESVLRLLKNDCLRNRIASAARRLVQDQYDWQKIMGKFMSIVDEKRLEACCRSRQQAKSEALNSKYETNPKSEFFEP